MVCIDLQDGLPEIEKDRGREAVERLLQHEPDMLLGVRINSPSTKPGERDLKSLKNCASGLHSVILPMIEHAKEVEAVTTELAEVSKKAGLIVVIETANAICDIDSICAACPSNAALLFGNADMSSSIRCANDWESLAYVRGRLIMFAAKWRLPAFDGVTIDLESNRLLEEDCIKGKRLGFAGKAAVHPKQIETINRTFSPTAEEQTEAREIVAAYEASSGGAIRVGNKMVDRPVYLAALNLLRN